MKKTILFILLLGAATFSVSAETISLIQGTFLSTSRIQEAGTEKLTETSSQIGSNFTFFVGKEFGFYSSISVVSPFLYSQKYTNSSTNESTEGSTPYSDLGFDMKMGMDTLLGLGYKINAGKSFSLILSGGLHVNALLLLDYYGDYISLVLGPGASANALFYLSDNFNLNIGFMGACDVVEVLNIPGLNAGVSSKPVFTYAITAGIGFKY